eukprot:GHVU01102312.1.p1 GENE.GHVU01102312.1~~GHVU01102312.1.p1  ORF type:complete len:346 (-),score=28.08 GHVU01102312.1:126-1163(-)
MKRLAGMVLMLHFAASVTAEEAAVYESLTFQQEPGYDDDTAQLIPSSQQTTGAAPARAGPSAESQPLVDQQRLPREVTSQQPPSGQVTTVSESPPIRQGPSHVHEQRRVQGHESALETPSITAPFDVASGGQRNSETEPLIQDSSQKKSRLPWKRNTAKDVGNEPTQKRGKFQRFKHMLSGKVELPEPRLVSIPSRLGWEVDTNQIKLTSQNSVMTDQVPTEQKRKSYTPNKPTAAADNPAAMYATVNKQTRSGGSDSETAPTTANPQAPVSQRGSVPSNTGTPVTTPHTTWVAQNPGADADVDAPPIPPKLQEPSPVQDPGRFQEHGVPATGRMAVNGGAQAQT